MQAIACHTVVHQIIAILDIYALTLVLFYIPSKTCSSPKSTPCSWFQNLIGQFWSEFAAEDNITTMLIKMENYNRVARESHTLYSLVEQFLTETDVVASHVPLVVYNFSLFGCPMCRHDNFNECLHSRDRHYYQLVGVLNRKRCK